jgi:hypothetical protein
MDKIISEKIGPILKATIETNCNLIKVYRTSHDKCVHSVPGHVMAIDCCLSEDSVVAIVAKALEIPKVSVYTEAFEVLVFDEYDIRRSQKHDDMCTSTKQLEILLDEELHIVCLLQERVRKRMEFIPCSNNYRSKSYVSQIIFKCDDIKLIVETNEDSQKTIVYIEAKPLQALNNAFLSLVKTMLV